VIFDATIFMVENEDENSRFFLSVVGIYLTEYDFTSQEISSAAWNVNNKEREKV
jgi:hypothetical protein